MDLTKLNKHEDVEVVTVDLIAQKHGKTKFYVKKQFRANMDFFKEGKDYFVIDKSLKSIPGLSNLFKSNAQKEAYLFTVIGYERLFQTMINDEKSILAHNHIIRDIFRIDDFQIPITNKRTQEELFDIIQAAILPIKIKRELKVGKYRVDGYIKEYGIIIECDENGHKKYNQEEEIKREQYIMDCLDTPDIVRFNPDDINFNIGYVIKEILDIIRRVLYARETMAILLRNN
jgi:very-short-patch-repair endonuclease